MNAKKLITIALILSAMLGLGVFFVDAFMADKTGKTVEWDLGNNDGGATPVVYDTGSAGADLTAANAQTCDDDGCTFDGTADYMTATGTGVYNNANVSIMIEFTPDFDYDDNNTRFFFDATGSVDRFKKDDNGSSNQLTLKLGGSNVT